MAPNGEKALRLSCWNVDVVRCRKLELDNYLSQHGVDICLLTGTHLRLEIFLTANCLPTYRPDYRGRRNSNIGPPRYRSLRCTRPRCEAPGRNCYSYNGHRTIENLGGLPVAHSASRQSGPVGLSLRRAPRTNDGRPECEARGLKLWADQDIGAAVTTALKVSVSSTGRDTHHYPIQLFSYIL